MKTLVIQSASESAPSWIQDCMETVCSWANQQNFSYQYIDDEIFQLVPEWYMEKIGNKYPVATDYARLCLLHDALEKQDYDQAIWVDADFFMFDRAPNWAVHGTCAFGQECWVSEKKGQLKVHNSVHNAFMVFRKGCPVLPYLAYTVESIIRRADADHISPQMVGPKLLSALHSISGFELLPQFTALSPEVIESIIKGGGEALDLFKQSNPVPVQGANICASLIEEQTAKKLLSKIEYLLAK